MPLFDFACRGCGHHFEDLVRSGDTSRCPRCESLDLERLAEGEVNEQRRPHGG